MSIIPTFDPPVDFELAAPFWDAIENEEIRLPQCRVCGRWQWYPDDAGSCHDIDDLVWQRVAGTGTVHTFTRVRRPFLPGGGDVPFTVVFLEMDGTEGMRLVANVDDDEIAIGDRVQVTFQALGRRKHPVFTRIL